MCLCLMSPFCCTTDLILVNMPISSVHLAQSKTVNVRTRIWLSSLLPGVLFLDRNAASDCTCFDPISGTRLCCQVPLPHSHSQSTWENKGIEQRTNVCEVTSPRAQLLTLHQWIVVRFSSSLLSTAQRKVVRFSLSVHCTVQSGVVLEEQLVEMLSVARAVFCLQWAPAFTGSCKQDLLEVPVTSPPKPSWKKSVSRLDLRESYSTGTQLFLM